MCFSFYFKYKPSSVERRRKKGTCPERVWVHAAKVTGAAGVGLMGGNEPSEPVAHSPVNPTQNGAKFESDGYS